jgi:hypothetical protein
MTPRPVVILDFVRRRVSRAAQLDASPEIDAIRKTATNLDTSSERVGLDPVIAEDAAARAKDRPPRTTP